MGMSSSLRVASFLARRSITRGNRGIVTLTVVLMAVIYADSCSSRHSSRERRTASSWSCVNR